MVLVNHRDLFKNIPVIFANGPGIIYGRFQGYPDGV